MSASSPHRAAGLREWAALFLLPFGWLLLPVFGWLVGVAFLWSSRVWTIGEKLIGTLVVPGGLSGVLIQLVLVDSSSCTVAGAPGQRTVGHCTGPALPPALGIPLVVICVIGGVATPVLLGRRALASRF